MHLQPLILVLVGLICCVQLALAEKTSAKATVNDSAFTLFKKKLTKGTCYASKVCKQAQELTYKNFKKILKEIKSNIKDMIESGFFVAHKISSVQKLKELCSQVFPPKVQLVLEAKDNICNKCVNFTEIATNIDKTIDECVQENEADVRKKATTVLNKIEKIVLPKNSDSETNKTFNNLIQLLKSPNGKESTIIETTTTLIDQLNNIQSKLSPAEQKIVKPIKEIVSEISEIKQGLAKQILKKFNDQVKIVKEQIKELKSQFPSQMQQFEEKDDIPEDIDATVTKKFKSLLKQTTPNLIKGAKVFGKIIIGILELIADYYRLKLCEKVNGYVETAGDYGSMLCAIFINVGGDYNPFEFEEKSIKKDLEILETAFKKAKNDVLVKVVKSLPKKYTELYSYKKLIEAKEEITKSLKKPEEVSEKCWAENTKDIATKSIGACVQCEKFRPKLTRKEFLSSTLKNDVQKCVNQTNILSNPCLINVTLKISALNLSNEQFSDCIKSASSTVKTIIEVGVAKAKTCKKKDTNKWFKRIIVDALDQNIPYQIGKCAYKKLDGITKYFGDH